MFYRKPLLAKKRASHVANHILVVVDGVEKLIDLKALSIDGNTISIYREILTGTHDTKSYVKNLYLYMRTKKLLKQGQTLYIKDIETTALLAQYSSEKALLFL